MFCLAVFVFLLIKERSSSAAAFVVHSSRFTHSGELHGRRALLSRHGR